MQGQFDITKLYWLNNKVKASTVEKYYLTNPITGKKVRKHKLVMIWDRDNVLKELAKQLFIFQLKLQMDQIMGQLH